VLAVVSFAAGAGAPSDADIWYDPSPGALLITYHEIFPELVDPDPTPRLRIFGDGRVLVHYSPRLRRAGDYELRLSATELEALLYSLVDNGLADFDRDDILREKRDVGEARAREALGLGEPPALFYVADDDISLFELRLLEYRAPGSTFAAGEIHQKIRWQGLRTDAERHPQIERIQRLRAAELTLRSLLVRDDLRRLR
jgi:hypothetical protein